MEYLYHTNTPPPQKSDQVIPKNITWEEREIRTSGCRERRKGKADSRQSQIRKFLLELLNKLLPYLMHLIKRLILIPLLNASIPAHGRHINHAIPKLDKRAPLDRQLEIRNIMQHEFDQGLILLLADPFDKRVRGERHAHLVGRQAILGKAKVEERRDGDGRRADLFLLLCEVGAADEADGYFVAQGGEEGQHGGRDGLWFLVSFMVWGFAGAA